MRQQLNKVYDYISGTAKNALPDLSSVFNERNMRFAWNISVLAEFTTNPTTTLAEFLLSSAATTILYSSLYDALTKETNPPTIASEPKRGQSYLFPPSTLQDQTPIDPYHPGAMVVYRGKK